MEVKDQLQQLITEQKGFHEKAQQELKTLGEVTGKTATQLDTIQKQVDALDVKMAEAQIARAAEQESAFDSELKSDDGVQRLLRDKRGKASLNLKGSSVRELMERKTTITSGASGTVGTSTTGVLSIGRLPEITTEVRQQLTIRDVLTARPTTFQVIDFLRVNAPMVIASPVAEGALKPENAVTFNTVSERVKTIATWIPATRQVLDDFSELMGFLKAMLPYYVELAEEQQLLTGDGTGENLHGLIPQATSFTTTLNSATKGWNKIDILGRAIQQITSAKELMPTFVVLNPADFWDLRLTKDGYGRYILGDPQDGAMTVTGFGITKPTFRIFGLDLIPTTSITSGTFLVGSGSPIAAEIRDRMEMQIDVSTEHSDFFTRNLVAIRAEKREVLIVRRPGSFITGTFNTSPA